MTREEMMDVIRANVREVLDANGVERLTEKDSLADIGADSLEIVEVVSRSMKQLRLRVKRTELTEAQNLGDLLDLFERAPRR